MLDVRALWIRLAPGLAGRDPFRCPSACVVAALLGAVLVTGCQVQRTLAPESTRQLRVARTLRVVVRPASSVVTWAPDGQRLAYSAAGNIWVSDLTGTERAIASVATPRAISWSKPLDLLALIDGGVVWTMRPDGSARKRMPLPGVAVDVVWAPGSDRLAVVLVHATDGDPRFELWLTNRDGGFQRLVIQAPRGSAIRDLQWFPDSLYLFYGLSAQTDQIITDAWRVRIAYPDRHQATIAGGARFLRLAPSGRLIAYLQGPDVGNGRGQVLVARPDGSGRVLLTSALERVDGLAWAPQGDKLAVAGLRTATDADLSMTNADGSDQTHLFSFTTEGPESTPLLSLLWNPNGRGIAVGTNTGGLTGPIWFIELTRR